MASGRSLVMTSRRPRGAASGRLGMASGYLRVEEEEERQGGKMVRGSGLEDAVPGWPLGAASG